MYGMNNFMPQYQSPYEQRLNSMQNNFAAVPPRQEVITVSGKNGADAFQLAPNSSVLLLDTTQAIIWLKTTDGAGYPTLTPYTITPYQEAPPVDARALEGRIAAIEKKLEGLNYEQPNVKEPEHSQSGTGTNAGIK